MFWQLYREEGPCAATDYFYHLCIVSNYIRTAQIAKNIKWEHPCRYGTLEITINLTKPEKGPQDHCPRAAAAAASYPKCMLCIENIGYAGRINFPARQYHRVCRSPSTASSGICSIPPYVYYNEHLHRLRRKA